MRRLYVQTRAEAHGGVVFRGRAGGVDVLAEVTDEELLVEVRPVLAEAVVELEAALRESASPQTALDAFAEARVLPLDRVDEGGDLLPFAPARLLAALARAAGLPARRPRP